MIKKLTALAAAAALCAGLCHAGYADEPEVSVLINGAELETDTAPIVSDGRTLVPVRAVCEALGCDVYWNEQESSITICDNNLLYMMWIDKPVAFAATPFIYSAVVMDVPPAVIDDRTLIPLRALSQLLPQADIEWNEASYIVSVTAELPAEPPEAGTAQEYSGWTSAYTQSYDAYAGLYTGDAEIINADIVLEDGSTITLELYPEIAPDTVNNFIQLAVSGCFDGKIFHRVINGFVVQGGAFDTDGTQYGAPAVKGEFLQNGFNNFLSHTRGVISMARTQYDPNSASNQFFITHQDAYSLDGLYAAFGKVISGMEYIDAIANAETDGNDKPLQDIIISKVSIKDAEKYSGATDTPVELTPIQNVTETVDMIAQSLGMSYAEFLTGCGLEPNQISKDSSAEELSKVLTLGAYIKVFGQGSVTYDQFLQANGIPANKVTTNTTLAELDKIINELN